MSLADPPYVGENTVASCIEMSYSRYHGNNLFYSRPMDHLTEDFKAIHASFRPRIHRYLTRLVGQNEAEDWSDPLPVDSQTLRN
jgi:hypothetical protein